MRGQGSQGGHWREQPCSAVLCGQRTGAALLLQADLAAPKVDSRQQVAAGQGCALAHLLGSSMPGRSSDSGTSVM